MSSNYQPKRNNPYYIADRDIYVLMVKMIQVYPKLRAAQSNPFDILVFSIERCIEELQAKYSKTCTGEQFDAYKAFMEYPVFCYYRSNPSRDEAPSDRTWKRYRSEFAYRLAKKLKYI